MTEYERIRDRQIELTYNGEPVADEIVAIPSANPTNYFQAMHHGDQAPPVTLEGRLFVPPVAQPAPCVILVPGSAGVTDAHVVTAQTLIAAGLATLVVDPFGARAVVSTAENQTQFSLAASALDVLRAFEVMRDHPAIDADRIAAQGTSRGGFAVLVAAMRRFADPIVGTDLGLRGVYASWPYSGHQFADPNVGDTRVRAVIGSIDDWCPVSAVQGQIRAIQVVGGDASIGILAGAHHGFDRTTGLERNETAMIAPGALMVYIDDDGAIIDPRSGVADPSFVDADVFRADARDGFAGVGATLGGTPETAAWYFDDMRRFYTDLF